jgi:hypothetical protein
MKDIIHLDIKVLQSVIQSKFIYLLVRLRRTGLRELSLDLDLFLLDLLSDGDLECDLVLDLLLERDLLL